MKTALKTLLIFMTIAMLTACKKKTHEKEEATSQETIQIKPSIIEGVGYAIWGVCLYNEPDNNPACPNEIPEGSQVKLLEAFVGLAEGEDIMKGDWYYKAEWNGKTGYIHGHKETFEYSDDFRGIRTISPLQAKVMVTSLRVREFPSMKSKNITTLKKDEELTVTGLGLTKFLADGKFDTWAQVKLKDGKLGYAFAGFLTGEGILRKIGTGERGFAILKTKPKTIQDIENFQPSPEWLKEMEAISKTKCGEECDFYVLNSKLVKDGRTYFLVRRQFMRYEQQSVPDKFELIDGWVDSAYVEAHGKDLLAHSRTKEKDKKKLAIIDFLNGKEKTIFHVDDFEITKKFEGLEPSTAFYVVEYDTRDQEFNIYVGEESWSNGTMVMEKNGKFYKLDFNFSDGIEPIDVNGDGIYEWIVTTPGRNDSTDYVYAYNDGGYDSIGSLYYGLGGECELRFYSDPGNPESGKKVYESPSENGECEFRNNKGVLEAKFGEKSILIDYDGEKLTIHK